MLAITRLNITSIIDQLESNHFRIESYTNSTNVVARCIP